MSQAKHTPGPWELGEYDEHLGYDCMTGGVRAGPVDLDGGDYGQKWCEQIAPESLARMMADARLIVAAPELLQALKACEAWITRLAESGDAGSWNPAEQDEVIAARVAIAKAIGEGT